MTRPSELLKTLTAGVYVVGVAAGEHRNAFTAAWVMQVSFDPLLVALSIHPRHRSYALLQSGGGFTVNLLASDQLDLARHFGQAATSDKLAGIEWRPGTIGAPILTESLAYLDCIVRDEYPAGDHRLVLGEVTGGEIQRPGEPMNYRDTGDMDGASRLYPEKF
ncbi:flavin reductase family protein [Methylohalobius crimeensis]|uniref:flavin reductase family protein n=1 Tax=Methylohalobius crimeensis TaxID=244365 RepID=UPI0003B5FC47|nr:flavin reductase family protein [Methylohalobius crimeensis]